MRGDGGKGEMGGGGEGGYLGNQEIAEKQKVVGSGRGRSRWAAEIEMWRIKTASIRRPPLPACTTAVRMYSTASKILPARQKKNETKSLRYETFPTPTPLIS